MADRGSMKINLRFILVAIFLFFFLILSMPIHLVVWLIGKKDPLKKYRMSARIVGWAFKMELWNSGVKLHTIGAENIPENQACLYVSNHRSYFDILVTQRTIGHPVGFVAKIEMRKIPLLTWWMEDIGCIFLDRKDIKQGLKTVLLGVEHLKAGLSMMICPEGTRNQQEEMLPFKDGSTKMAEKAKVPVVPMAIIGTDNLLENNGGCRIRKGEVKVIYGKPFYMSELEPEQKKHSGVYIQGLIQQMIDENK